MKNNFTFSMIKPEIIKSGQVGEIITQIEQNGFNIKALQMIKLSLDNAKKFYEVHQARPFYGELCEYISSGSVVAMILEKDNAVTDFRNLIGATNPTDAASGTIRNKFGKSIDANAIHGSDSLENALIEANFFFPNL